MTRTGLARERKRERETPLSVYRQGVANFNIYLTTTTKSVFR